MRNETRHDARDFDGEHVVVPKQTQTGLAKRAEGTASDCAMELTLQADIDEANTPVKTKDFSL